LASRTVVLINMLIQYEVRWESSDIRGFLLIIKSSVGCLLSKYSCLAHVVLFVSTIGADAPHHMCAAC